MPLPPMLIKEISIDPSRVMPGNWVLIIESRTGHKCTFHFDADMTNFFAAVEQAMVYFGQAYGIITYEQAQRWCKPTKGN